MFRSNLKTIVRSGKGKFGIGVQLFKLSSVSKKEDDDEDEPKEDDEDELTDEEKAALKEEGVNEDDEDEKDKVAIMRIYEDIGEDFWSGTGMSVNKFADALDKLGSI